MSFITRLPIAHRGLHDGNETVYENSMSAFRAAVERWNYSPVRLASYETPAALQELPRASNNEYVGTIESVIQTDLRKPASRTRVNEGWRRD